MLSRCRSIFIYYYLALAVAVMADVNIVTKAQWNGRESKVELTKLTLPVGRVVVSHTAGGGCSTQDSCAQQVRTIQSFHIEKMHFDDIAYNFLIGNDGNVYEGRGWELQGAFAMGYNAGSIGIAFIGNYEREVPTTAALDAAKTLLEQGVNLGKLSNDYKLYGHRQLVGTNSPGSALYELIKLWPHWSRDL